MDNPKEITLHMQIAKLLRDHCLPDWRWTHIASGGKRDLQTARKLKQMGTQKGWPDFILVRGGSGIVHFLELKRAGGSLSPDQREFAEWCVARDVPFAVARSLGEALEALGEWGALNVRMV